MNSKFPLRVQRPQVREDRALDLGLGHSNKRNGVGDLKPDAVL